MTYEHPTLAVTAIYRCCWVTVAGGDFQCETPLSGSNCIMYTHQMIQTHHIIEGPDRVARCPKALPDSLLSHLHSPSCCNSIIYTGYTKPYSPAMARYIFIMVWLVVTANAARDLMQAVEPTAPMVIPEAVVATTTPEATTAVNTPGATMPITNAATPEPAVADTLTSTLGPSWVKDADGKMCINNVANGPIVAAASGYVSTTSMQSCICESTSAALRAISCS